MLQVGIWGLQSAPNHFHWILLMQGSFFFCLTKSTIVFSISLLFCPWHPIPPPRMGRTCFLPRSPTTSPSALHQSPRVSRTWRRRRPPKSPPSGPLSPPPAPTLEVGSCRWGGTKNNPKTLLGCQHQAVTGNQIKFYAYESVHAMKVRKDPNLNVLF